MNAIGRSVAVAGKAVGKAIGKVCGSCFRNARICSVIVFAVFAALIFLGAVGASMYPYCRTAATLATPAELVTYVDTRTGGACTPRADVAAMGRGYSALVNVLFIFSFTTLTVIGATIWCARKCETPLINRDKIREEIAREVTEASSGSE